MFGVNGSLMGALTKSTGYIAQVNRNSKAFVSFGSLRQLQPRTGDPTVHKIEVGGLRVTHEKYFTTLTSFAAHGFHDRRQFRHPGIPDVILPSELACVVANFPP